MRIADRAAHLALSWVFLRAGFDVLRNPAKPAATAGPFLAGVRGMAGERVALPADPVLVRMNATVQVAAATSLAFGRAPRLSAAALLGSLVPTTAAGHAFWRFDEPAVRANQRNHFNKNIAMAGGLLLVLTARPAHRTVDR
jgi:uncharacterized membrane protein YphA (DoxX/SURF4 family)